MRGDSDLGRHVQLPTQVGLITGAQAGWQSLYSPPLGESAMLLHGVVLEVAEDV